MGSQLERSGALLDVLYEAPFEGKGWLSFLRALECDLEGYVAMLCMPAPSNDGSGLVVAPSLGLGFAESYRSSWFRADPWLREANALAVGEIVAQRDSLGGERLSETSFYREWMAPQGLRPALTFGGVGDREAHRPPSLLTVFQRGDVPPCRHAIPLLRELMPHLRRALRTHFGSARLVAERAALAAALDRLPLAAIVVERCHRVRITNRGADRLLARRDGLFLDRDGLHATRPDDDARLRRVLAGAFEGAERLEAEGAVLLERSLGRSPLRASVSRVPSPEGDGAALAVVFVSDPEAELELPGEAMSRFHALTSAESALVRELANGRSLQEAAARLRITEGTARQRLVQVFEKTGTKRQSALVRLVLSGPESLAAGE